MLANILLIVKQTVINSEVFILAMVLKMLIYLSCSNKFKLFNYIYSLF